MRRSVTKRRRWSPSDVATLRSDYPDAPTYILARRLRRAVDNVYHKAAHLGLRKSAAYLAGPWAYRFRRGDHQGRATQFRPGQTPWNKGTHFVAGGRSAETRFKPGNVSKRWDPEIYIVGALRINCDGGLDIKLHDGLRAWYSMARWVWETERGPIPRGRVVRCRNGDAHDVRIANLRLAKRADVMRENTLHNYPKPLARAIQLRGALNRRINHLEKHRAEHAR